MSTKKGKKSQKDSPVQAMVIEKLPATDNGVSTFFASDKGIWLFTFISFVLYYIFSFFHTSFYQGEEGAQYMNMKAIWHDSNSVLGNWPKAGWKILYALPALVGKDCVLIVNCLFAAFTGFFTAKVIKLYDGKWPVIGQILLLSQPLWFYLAFKNYSEISTAFLIILSVYFATKEKFLVSALLISFVFLIRQEFIYMLMIYGVYLFIKKKYIAFLALGVFPVLYALWGWAATGDMLYLLHSSAETAKDYKAKYPRQGFEHYFIMSEVIFGAVCVVGLLIYISQITIQRVVKPAYFIIVPIGYFFLIHCVFNDTVFQIGPSTGGNLRYMLSISPLFAVAATLGIEKMAQVKKNNLALILLVPLFLFALAYMGYEHNWVKFHPEEGKNMIFPLLTLGTIVLLFIITGKYRLYTIIFLALLQMALLISPKELKDDENAAQKEIVEWSKEQQFETKYPMLSSLALFTYFYDKNPWEFSKGYDGISAETINKAPVGTIIFWDTHYASKYGKVELNFFNAAPTKFKLLRELVSTNMDIQILVFQKVVL